MIPGGSSSTAEPGGTSKGKITKKEIDVPIVKGKRGPKASEQSEDVGKKRRVIKKLEEESEDMVPAKKGGRKETGTKPRVKSSPTTPIVGKKRQAPLTPQPESKGLSKRGKTIGVPKRPPTSKAAAGKGRGRGRKPLHEEQEAQQSNSDIDEDIDVD